MRTRAWSTILSGFLALGVGTSAVGQSFVNFESPQIHPIDVTPDGTFVLVTNTADNRLAILDRLDAGNLRLRTSVPVGLEPVSVRALDETTAWVVNHLSDSVSIVDLNEGRVVATLQTGDEPADVVFAGSPRRAFVSISQENRIMVFDPANPDLPPVSVPVEGQEPRALATDGSKVFSAIFEAGNLTTVLSEFVVASDLNPYPGDPNPPPNSGMAFEPSLNPMLPEAPHVSMIVRRDENGVWLDDNGGDWSDAVGWDLHGHGLVVMDPDSLEISYRTGLSTTNMACASRPGGGVVVVGTEAINEVRFEPNLAGRFIRVEGSIVTPGTRGDVVRRDLNPHLDYLGSTIPFTERIRSIGDPRGVVCSPDGAEVWVSGMGSNNVVVHDEDLGRLDRIVVGNGPTGITMDPTGSHVYVLNRFDATVTVLDRVSRKEIGLLRLFDPTPHFIKDGRPLLYDTHLTSGLGHTSCNSCHIDGRIDQLAWDLGDPSGDMKAFNQSCDLDLPDDNCEDWHPMKGSMTTQTLTGLNGTAPFHWRGDREDFAAFDHAFTSILGNDADGTPAEMAAMQAFLGSIANPPNPNRRLDGSLPDEILGGDPTVGLDGFHFGELATIQCIDCHSLPNGSMGMVISADLLQESQAMKVAQLSNMYEKQGMDKTSSQGSKGFGFQHDGSMGTLVEFFERPAFTFPNGAAGDQLRRDIVALMMCWDTGTHTGVGAQAQQGGASPDPIERRDLLVTLALSGEVDLVVRMNLEGRDRGGVLLADGRIQTDVAAQVIGLEDLDALADPSMPVTYTLVPSGSGVRIGVDRDLDGFFDLDEILACADPADASSTPENAACIPDLNGDGRVDGSDIGLLFAAWGVCPDADCPADFTGDGLVDSEDLGVLLAAWSV